MEPYDFTKFAAPSHLHVCFRALALFFEERGAIPRPYNKEDSDLFFKISSSLADVSEAEDFLRKFSFTCSAQINPIVRRNPLLSFSLSY